MENRPWHDGYFADEGEKETDDEDPEWEPLRTTSIAATPYGLAVLASLVADMQRQLGHLPKNLGYGLEPIYSPTHASGNLLEIVVATTEATITSFGPQAGAQLRQQSPRGVSREASERKTFYDTWGQTVEIGVAALAGVALIHLFPPGGGKGGAGLHFRWMLTGPNVHIARKVAATVAIEAKFDKSMLAEQGTQEAFGLYGYI